jgi:hypothetical protein
MMARPGGHLARFVLRSHLSGAGLVARIVLSTDVCGVHVFWDSGKAVHQIVQEPHNERVRALGLGGQSAWRRRFEVPTGDHVRFARGCCTLASGTLTGTVRRHMSSIRAKPTSMAA